VHRIEKGKEVSNENEKELVRFKVGDKVRVIKGRDDVLDKNGGLGIVGIVIEVAYRGSTKNTGTIRVESALFTNSPYNSAWYFFHPELELVASYIPTTVTTSPLCPRCQNTLIKKQSEGFFGEKYIIQKCTKCNWC
jgi:tRNA(Ile2) C34 agmatinyltransferase TiaS